MDKGPLEHDVSVSGRQSSVPRVTMVEAYIVQVPRLLGRHVHGQAPFYQGKTIALIQAGEPGGTGDMRVKAVIPFLRKYIPGNPNILVEYMPGGGGRKAGNYIFGSAPGRQWGQIFTYGIRSARMLKMTVPA